MYLFFRRGNRFGSADEVLAVGSRLRVKYGKGSNLRAYEAKVLRSVR